jgi:hypothetical protein
MYLYHPSWIGLRENVDGSGYAWIDGSALDWINWDSE